MSSTARLALSASLYRLRWALTLLKLAVDGQDWPSWADGCWPFSVRVAYSLHGYRDIHINIPHINSWGVLRWISRGQSRPHCKGAGPRHFLFWGFPSTNLTWPYTVWPIGYNKTNSVPQWRTYLWGRVSHAAIPRGGAPALPNYRGSPLLMPTSFDAEWPSLAW